MRRQPVKILTLPIADRDEKMFSEHEIATEIGRGYEISHISPAAKETMIVVMRYHSTRQSFEALCLENERLEIALRKANDRLSDMQAQAGRR